jgi:hypothetical protein
MNKIKIILFTLLVFLIINIIIVILWPIKVNLGLNNYKHYSEEFLKSLDLSQKDGTKLYLETWQRERLFEYDEYTGIKESESKDAEFVNITDEDGRFIERNPNTCTKNIFFYGGELVFGYDVTDKQTIPNYFNNLLKLNNETKYCVYNFGRGTYFSTQENILLQKHILNDKIKIGDIIIFIDGENEQGNQKILNTEFIDNNYNDLHQKYWKLYKVGVRYFFNLLPTTQFYHVINKKNFNKNDNSKISDNKLTTENEIIEVYKKNLKIRKGVCKEYDLKCFNFLLLVDISNKNIYEKFKKIQNVIDLTKNFSWERNKNGIFTPKSNEIVSQNIYKHILN